MKLDHLLALLLAIVVGIFCALPAAAEREHEPLRLTVHPRQNTVPHHRSGGGLHRSDLGSGSNGDDTWDDGETLTLDELEAMGDRRRASRLGDTELGALSRATNSALTNAARAVGRSARDYVRNFGAPALSLGFRATVPGFHTSCHGLLDC